MCMVLGFLLANISILVSKLINKQFIDMCPLGRQQGMVVFMEIEHHSEKWKSFRVKDNCYVFVALILSIFFLNSQNTFLFILLLFHFINIFDICKLIYQTYVNT